MSRFRHGARRWRRVHLVQGELPDVTRGALAPRPHTSHGRVDSGRHGHRALRAGQAPHGHVLQHRGGRAACSSGFGRALDRGGMQFSICAPNCIQCGSEHSLRIAGHLLQSSRRTNRHQMGISVSECRCVLSRRAGFQACWGAVRVGVTFLESASRSFGAGLVIWLSILVLRAS